MNFNNILKIQTSKIFKKKNSLIFLCNSDLINSNDINPKFINSHLRFSFGWTTKAGDGSKAAEIVMQAVKEIE